MTVFWMALSMAACLLTATPAGAQCAGDCNENGAVAVNELVLGVNIVLDRAGLDGCPSFDGNDDRRVTVNELVAAVNNTLRGCGFAGRYRATVELDPPLVGDIELLAASNGEINGTLVVDNAVLQGSALGSEPVGLSGTFDPITGAFEVTGTIPNQIPIPVRLSGQLGGAFTLQIGDQFYAGSFTNGATPTPTPTRTPGGTVHTVTVGQTNLPFDPELLTINPGDTVVWMWVGGPHSVRSAGLGQDGLPLCTSDGRFDSGAQSSGTFSFTFSTPGRYGYHCGVAGHCAEFESAIIEVRGTPTASPTRTFTPTPTIAVPTSTPTPDTIGGVSTRMLGFFSGTVTIGTQTFPGRMQILVDDFGPFATDLSMPVPFIFPNPVRMEVITPTELLYELEGPPPVRFSLTLNDAQHVIGRYTVDDPIMPRLPTDYDLTREP
jgi:plastocyanin